jgi:hypothetical protein
VLKDVDNYFPLLQDGGIVVVDDISWDSVKPALEILDANSKFIGKMIDNQNDFAIFIKNPTIEQFESAKKIFNMVITFDY